MCNGDAVTRRDIFLQVLSLLTAGKALHGQQADAKISVDVKVVNVLATVRNKQGQITRDLVKENFAVEEDGRAQTIRYFAQQSNLPLTLGLLVDTSMSQRRVLPEQRRASYRFLQRVLREDKDLAFVIHFDSEVELLQDLTSSRKDLEAALEKLELPTQPQWGGRGQRGPGSPGGQGGGGRRRGGGTNLYDAVLLASDELMKKQSGRKALILLSDGVDTGSRLPITDAIESAQRAETLVYSIRFFDDQAYGNRTALGGMGGRRHGGMGGPPSRLPQSHPDGKKVLERLARETGGGYFDVSKKQTIDKTFEQIEEELRNQYSLGYTPDKNIADSGFRNIKVTVNKPNLIVQTRGGYYPAP